MRTTNLSNRTFYSLLVKFMEVNGRSPTFQEIEMFTGLEGLEAIRYHLEKLQDEGKIEYKTIKILKPKIRIKENIYE